MPAPLLALIALFLLCTTGLAQTPPTTKQVPPVGIDVPEDQRQGLLEGARRLRKALDELVAELNDRPKIAQLLPDVEIFHKAVHDAVAHGEIFDKKEIAFAEKLLAEGNSRLEALRKGTPDWTTQTGLVVRGYRSRIDHSVQPYGLVIPESWNADDRRPHRLDLWLHGRNDKLTELAFLNERMNKRGEFTPADTFVLHPYGRFCNATKFAGETDVFEAMAHVSSQYPIDPQRLLVRGFSMGGASAWHLGAHHAGLWAAVAPGAGFAETAEYTRAFGPGKEPPPWWEQVLWRLYDATAYAPNLANVPVIAYSGEDDQQRQAADVMAKAMTAAGLDLPHLIGPKTGHKYEPETKRELSARVDELGDRGRELVPAKVQLTTYTLRYPRQEWVEVTGLEKHWDRADVSAQLHDDKIELATNNVSALKLELPSNAAPAALARTRIIIDGKELAAPDPASPWVARFQKTDGQWRVAASDEATAPLQKRHGLQGPIDDAFTDSFVFVKPTGEPLNAKVGDWVQGEIARVVPQWRKVFRGEARVVEDRAVTSELIANANLVLWGDPSSNSVLAKILPQLPIQWTAEGLRVGKATYPAESHIPVMIFPNPLNPKRYVVLNSSFTFRQGSDTSNALQTPKLPDWVVVDLRTPPTPKDPGLVVDAGFFDEHWRLPSDL